jgi:phosphatidylinositol alpha-1,6-mannosyltransferase
MSRRHVELVRRLGPGSVLVSTVAPDPEEREAAAQFDAGEPYPIARQRFAFRGAKTIFNQIRWARTLTDTVRSHGSPAGRADASRATPNAALPVLFHCGNIRPAGYPVWWAHRTQGTPYLLYVYGGDLLRERRKIAEGASARQLKRLTARRIFGSAAGVVAISDWTADLARSVMTDAGLREMPPVLASPLGTDPRYFRPDRDTGQLRRKLGIGDSPLLVTVSRLVPHKGIDVALRAVAALISGHPTLSYLIVGRGEDEARLAALAKSLGISDRVRFAGTLSDAEIAEAYATATVYVGLSRVDAGINAEGFGIAFVEAAASGTPSVAGDSGGVRSAVRDGETGLIVPPTDVAAAAAAIDRIVTDADLRRVMSAAARRAAEQYYNWDRVAGDVLTFAERVTSDGGRPSTALALSTTAGDGG